MSRKLLHELVYELAAEVVSKGEVFTAGEKLQEHVEQTQYLARKIETIIREYEDGREG